MALHWYIKKKATDFKGFYIFLIAKRAEKDDFSQKSDEDGLTINWLFSRLNQFDNIATPLVNTNGGKATGFYIFNCVSVNICSN
jgi:hypothetical protein